MIKKSLMLKRFFAGSMALMLALTSTVASAVPVQDQGNPQIGTNGHSEFSWYVAPTSTPDVYKVSMSMDVYVKPKKAEIILVLDNSGSMGRPYDLSDGVWQGADQAGLNELDQDGNKYFIPEEAYTDLTGKVHKVPATNATKNAINYIDPGTILPVGIFLGGINYGAGMFKIPKDFAGIIDNSLRLNDSIPQGAYVGGSEGNRYFTSANAGLLTPASTTYPDYELTTYRLEWVRTAAAKVLDDLLTEESNPVNYDQIKISIIAFGGANSDINTTKNPFYWKNGDPGYNNGAGVNQGVGGGGPLGTSTTIPTASTNAITYQSGWIDYENLANEKDKFLHNYVRRNENTYVVAGLEAAMTKFDALTGTSEWAPENRHVFVLADGGDNSTANLMNAAGSINQVWSKDINDSVAWPGAFFRSDPTRTLAAAAKLKNPNEYNAKITSVGLLNGNEHSSAAGTKGFLDLSALTGTDGSYPERHLLLMAAPLLPTAKQFQTGAGYYGNAITEVGGSQKLLDSDALADHLSYTLLASNSTSTANAADDFIGTTASSPAKNGYGEFVKDTIAHLDPSYGPGVANSHYQYAADASGVAAAFEEFSSQFKQSATDIKVTQKLTNMFQVYQMPGEPLYAVSDGEVTISGRDIKWEIDTVKAKGGAVTLTYYVKFDSANADPTMHYPFAEYTNVSWMALGKTQSTSQFPTAMISGDTSSNGWKVDNNNNTGMNSVNDSSTPSTINATGNVMNDITSSTNTTTVSTGEGSQGGGGGIAFLGAGPQPYKASVANTAATKKAKKTTTDTSNEPEKLSDSEYKAVKGKSLKTKSSKVAVYIDANKSSKVSLYLAKDRTFKIAGATKNYYMIQYKKKDGKVQKGYILKTDVNVIK